MGVSGDLRFGNSPAWAGEAKLSSLSLQVDAFEVLSAAIILGGGSTEEKIEVSQLPKRSSIEFNRAPLKGIKRDFFSNFS